MYILFLLDMIVTQYRPSSAYDTPFLTTNAGGPVYNNVSSLTVGPRGILMLDVELV